jgi:2-dehydro-3-deoxyphosphogluconate aldolase/(4S)-4-hydroxy-2-oxoglutarate aldolase
MDIAETQVLEQLALNRVIALADVASPYEIESASAALLRGRIRCIELAAPSIPLIRAARRVDGLMVGAGHVHTAEQAEEALRGGAHFATAPVTNIEVVRACRELALPFFPGVATPSEVDRLILLGLRTLRVFPSGPLGGPGFLQAVSAVYPEVRFIPSGGIGPELLRPYLSVPSVLAVGVSGVVRHDLMRAGNFERVEWLARETMRAHP